MTTATKPEPQRLSGEELIERRRELLSHIRSHGPCNLGSIVEALPHTIGEIKSDLRVLHEMGCIKPGDTPGLREWQFVQSMAMQKAPQLPSVRIMPARRFAEPGPEITKIEAGVKYTFKAAPKDRFHVDLPASGGVISYDNPRLSAALSGAA